MSLPTPSRLLRFLCAIGLHRWKYWTHWQGIDCRKSLCCGRYQHWEWRFNRWHESATPLSERTTLPAGVRSL